MDIVNRFGLLVDLQEWDEVRDLLAEEIWFDYSDFDGHEPQRISKEKLIQSWRELITGFDSVQHIITNHVIDQQNARRFRCRAHARTYHTLSNVQGCNSWTLGAVYTFGIEKVRDRWQIIRIEFKVLWSKGNPLIYDEAVKRGRTIII